MPVNNPETANYLQIGPKMILESEMIPTDDTPKNRNGVDSMLSLRIQIYFTIILGEEKRSASGTKATIKNGKHTAQNTKLTHVHCINFWDYDAET